MDSIRATHHKPNGDNLNSENGFYQMGQIASHTHTHIHTQEKRKEVAVIEMDW